MAVHQDRCTEITIFVNVILSQNLDFEPNIYTVNFVQRQIFAVMNTRPWIFDKTVICRRHVSNSGSLNEYPPNGFIQMYLTILIKILINII